MWSPAPAFTSFKFIPTFLLLRVALSHAGQWLNTARRVLAHVRAYLDSGQYGECRDNEQATACECEAT